MPPKSSRKPAKRVAKRAKDSVKNSVKKRKGRRRRSALVDTRVIYCGDNLEHVVEAYARIPGLAFVDVGWGSDVAACRKALPETYFSLRLNPARMRTQSPADVRADVGDLVEKAGPLEKLALCCIGMDAETPDENVRAIFEAAERCRHARG